MSDRNGLKHRPVERLLREALESAEFCIVAFARRLGHAESEVHTLTEIRAALSVAEGREEAHYTGRMGCRCEAPDCLNEREIAERWCAVHRHFDPTRDYCACGAPPPVPAGERTEAPWCETCDGSGLALHPSRAEPIDCPTCGGSGRSPAATKEG